MASYSDVEKKELWAQHRQWLKAKKDAVRCEDGHESCGCSTEPSQDGKALCHREVERELIWRQSALETVEAE